MSAEENKALPRRMIEEVFNAGNLEVVDEIVSQDHVHHDPAMPEEGHGREHAKEFASMYRSAFPDLHVEIDDQEHSETYTERLIYCPDCGQRLERMELNEIKV